MSGGSIYKYAIDEMGLRVNTQTVRYRPGPPAELG